MSKKYWVYILTNHTNSVFYTGITNDLHKRIDQHKSGQDKKSFASRYRLYKLIWFEEFNHPQDAIAAEKKIKGWRREKKIKLIKSTNPQFKNLNT